MPFCYSGGRLTVRLASGALDSFVLDSHKPLYELDMSIKQLQQK
jgi:hypothetical protein